MQKPSQEILHTLPHAGLALVCGDARVDSPTQATGRFRVDPDDPRVIGHFGIMMGVLIAEFAHQTAAFLILKSEPGNIPMLKSTHLEMQEPAFPGEQLVCQIALDHREDRDATFTASVFVEKDGEFEKKIATVAFTGTIVPKRLLDRMCQKAKMHVVPA